MKKVQFLLLSAMICSITTTSCSDDDSFTESATYVKSETEKATKDLPAEAPLTMVSQNTVFMGNVPGGIKQHFTNVGSTVTNATRVLVVTRNAAVSSKSVIDKVENAGGVIVYIEDDANKYEITGRFLPLNSTYTMEKCDLSKNAGECASEDNAVLDLSQYITYNPSAPTTISSTAENIAEDSERYNPLANWINEQFDAMKEKVTRAATRAGDASRSLDISQFTEQERVTATFNFDRKACINFGFDKKRYIEGSGSVTNSYTIYKLHALDNQDNSGDYYFVKCSSSIASGNMFKGRWTDTVFLFDVNQIGFYLKDVEFIHEPVDENGQIYSNADVMIPADGCVTPTTTIGQTSVTDSKSFTFNVQGKVGHSSGVKGQTPESSTSGEISVGASWNWSHSENQVIKDLDILDMSAGCLVAHKYQVNNGPKYDSDQPHKFTEGSAAGRSTIVLNSSWVWYLSKSKDDDSTTALNIRSGYKANYEIAAKVRFMDPRKERTSVEGCQTLPIKSPDRSSIGYVELENTFDDMTISDITLYNGDKIVYKDDNTYSPKEKAKFCLGRGNRSIRFKAGKNAATAKTYELVDGQIMIEKGKTKVLKSAYNFM